MHYWQSAPALARLLGEDELLVGAHPETLEVRALRVELARLGLARVECPRAGQVAPVVLGVICVAVAISSSDLHSCFATTPLMY